MDSFGLCPGQMLMTSFTDRFVYYNNNNKKYKLSQSSESVHKKGFILLNLYKLFKFQFTPFSSTCRVESLQS